MIMLMLPYLLTSYSNRAEVTNRYDLAVSVSVRMLKALRRCQPNVQAVHVHVRAYKRPSLWRAHRQLLHVCRQKLAAPAVGRCARVRATGARVFHVCITRNAQRTGRYYA